MNKPHKKPTRKHDSSPSRRANHNGSAFSYASLEPRQLLAADLLRSPVIVHQNVADYTIEIGPALWNDVAKKADVASAKLAVDQNGAEPEPSSETVEGNDAVNAAGPVNAAGHCAADASESEKAEHSEEKCESKVEAIVGDGDQFFALLDDDELNFNKDGSMPGMNPMPNDGTATPTATPGAPPLNETPVATSEPTNNPTVITPANEPFIDDGLEPISMLAGNNLESSLLATTIEHDLSEDTYFTKNGNDDSAVPRLSNDRLAQTGMIGRYQTFSIINSKSDTGQHSVSLPARDAFFASQDSSTAASHVTIAQKFERSPNKFGMNKSANFDLYFPTFSNRYHSASELNILLQHRDYVSSPNSDTSQTRGFDWIGHPTERRSKTETRLDNDPISDSQDYEMIPTYKSQLLFAVVLVANHEDRHKRQFSYERDRLSRTVAWK